MNPRQKSALRARSMTLADQLIMDEDLYGALKQHKVFTENMLQIIKMTKKPKAQVYKLLELLEKRGPQAFSKFVEILDENYDWLADELRESYDQKMQESQAKHKTKSYSGVSEEASALTPRAKSVSRLQLKGTPRAPYPVPIQASLSSVGSIDAESSRDYPDNGAEPFYEDEAASDKMSDTNDDPEDSDHESEHEIPMDDTVFQSEDIPEATTDGGNAMNDSIADNTIGGTLRREETESELQKKDGKKYKDQCLSPINIIDATRKTVNANCSPIRDIGMEAGEDVPDGYFRVSEEVQIDEQGRTAQTYITDGHDAKSAGVFPKGEELNKADNEDEQTTDDELAPSEVFYDKLRRKSGLLEIDLNAMNIETDEQYLKSEDSSDSFIKLEEENEIREIYVKCLKGVIHNSEVKDMDLKEKLIETRLNHIDESGITFTMINDQIDELIKMIDDKRKIIDKAHSMFENKDKKLSLVLCIEQEREEKKQLKERLMEEIRKVNEMANDMYQHSQDMKGLEKLKNRSGMFERENDALKGKCAQLELERADLQRELERAKRESVMASTDDKRLGKKQASPRRNVTTTSPRRGSSYQTTRLYQQYGQPGQSPRTSGSLVQPWRTTGLNKK